jgi:hypothetical protein
MYELNGVVCADDPEPLLTIKKVRPLENWTLLIGFSTGEEKKVNILPLLNEPVFRALKDVALFNSVYIDYGTVVWANGAIDIAPEYLYQAAASE